MTVLTTLQWISYGLAVTALVQSLEFLRLRAITADDGVWRWADLQIELGRGFRPLLKNFTLWNLLRIAAAAVVLIKPTATGTSALLVCHVLTLLRWRGSFNGGSDAMTLLTLWTTALGLASPDRWGAICLWFLALQVSLSYFKAGWYKLHSSTWRTGRALDSFFHSTVYSPLNLPSFGKTANWILIGFELTFPLSLLHPSIAVTYMAIGFMFHIANAYFFGLNRFLFAWSTAYPALYYCANA